MTGETLVGTLALVGLVIVVSALLSGIVERRGWPQVWVFLALGALLGAPGAGMISFALDSSALRVVATLALTLVLFTDAVGVNLKEVRASRRIAWMVLGPGTILPAAIVAVAAWSLLDVSVPGSIVVGAALASTDPVMLRGLLRRPDLPRGAALALRLESGLNDVVLLPPVVLAMLFMLGNQAPSMTTILGDAAGLLLLGPIAGVAIGLVGIRVLVWVRTRFGVRRDYESIYAIGLAFAAFAAAEAAHGSGFLAAFTAGLTIAALDVELCDCFLDFGQASAEMFLLLTFVAFGAAPIWLGLDVFDGRVVVFALIALVARTVILLPALRATDIDATGRSIVAWFGPRGLSTLLLALLPVFAGIAGSERLFAICAAVVLLSVVLHGTALMVFGRRADRREHEGGTIAGPRRELPVANDAPSLDGVPVGERITLDELDTLRAQGKDVIVLDVRTERSYGIDALRAAASVRMPPDEAVQLAARLNLSRGAILAAYCT